MARLRKNINKDIVTIKKTEIVSLLIAASKWGSWAYTKGEREKRNKVSNPEFQRWREDEMITLLEEHLKNKNGETETED